MRHHRIQHAGRRQHARQAGARVGAGADEVEPVHFLAAVVRPEPGALGQHRLHREGGALVAVEPVLEVLRREHQRGDHLVFQPRQQRLAQALGDGGAVGLGAFAPVDAGIQVRHGGQHIEGVAAGRGQARVGGRGAVQVEAEVVGQVLLREDVVQQALVARAQRDGVVGHVGVLAPRAEVPDEQAHRVARLGDAPVRPVAPVASRQQALVGEGRIRVAHHHIGRHHRA
mmetsp:Transcript_53793/g.126972  ORF Transcript_53793/g.126972 Transcript_53793/m.126972 type:complete len:228 (-) Transcript_53793:961-1644(-)